MRTPTDIHEELISLKHLYLDGQRLNFGRAFLSLGADRAAPSWSCSLRGVLADELGRLQGERQLRAQALDGRGIEGRVTVPGVALPYVQTATVVVLAGVGPLSIEGREL